VPVCLPCAACADVGATVLGVPYDPALDMWSVGCTLYELYTGKILFPGRSNNQMLLLHMELKGRCAAKLLKRAHFASLYFDAAGAFAGEAGPVHVAHAKRDLRARLVPPPGTRLPDEEARALGAFVDLLDKCLALDPAKRLTPREALMHPFIRG
jgi:serine/threonine-protein kinase PRP4